MAGNVILLGEVARHLDMLGVRCDRCDRYGRLRIDRLLAQHGPDAPVGTVMRALVSDCPQRDAQPERERCDPYAPELWEFSVRRRCGDRCRAGAAKGWARQFLARSSG